MRRAALVVICLAALVGAPPAGAATIHVNCAKKALQPKLDSAPAGSTILVKGTCVGTAVIQKNLTLKGNPTATIDGNNASSAVYITGNPKVRLVHLKITRGAGLQGAGVTSFGSVTLDHCTVTGNHAQITGAGILAANRVTLIDSSVVHNTLEWDATNAVVTGAGISAGSVRLVRSTVRFNTAHAISAGSTATATGGGIAVSNGVVAIRSHIDKNKARADGQTTAARGGGIAEQLPGATIRLTNSTVSKNTATGSSTALAGAARGGGVYASKVIAKRTDFVGNRLVAVSPTQGATAIGGGLYVLQTGSFTGVHIRNSAIRTDSALNTQARGAGITGVSGTERITVTRSTMSGNAATAVSSGGFALAAGGAMDVEGPLSMARSTLSKNSAKATSATSGAEADGGAINSDGLLAVQSSTLSGNLLRSTTANAGSFVFGGAIAVEDVDELGAVTNSTLTGNTARAFAAVVGGSAVATSGGGGISIGGAPLRLTNTTVARNTVSSQGALITSRGGGLIADFATFELRGTLLAANTAPDAPDCYAPIAITSLGYNLVTSLLSCTFAVAGTDKLNKPAKLGKFGAHGGPTRTIPLMKGSPALNAIPKASCKVKSDQRGVKRPQEKRCEIGAWERGP